MPTLARPEVDVHDGLTTAIKYQKRPQRDAERLRDAVGNKLHDERQNAVNRL